LCEFFGNNVNAKTVVFIISKNESSQSSISFSLHYNGSLQESRIFVLAT